MALLDRIISEGVSPETGGEHAQRWARKVSRKSAHSLCAEGDCEDMGLYGITNMEDDNVIYGLLRSGDFEGFDLWQESGWVPHDLPDQLDLRILSEDEAQFIISALREGCDGAYLHPGSPLAFLAGEVTVVAAASSEHDEEKHPRDATGKFAAKDDSQKSQKGRIRQQSRAKARAADMARYVRDGGPRPGGVAPAAKKGGSSKGGGKGGAGSGKARGSKSGGTSKGASRSAARKQDAKARAAWQAEKDKVTTMEHKERLAKAESDLAAENESRARAAKAESRRKEIGAKFAERVAQGMSIEKAERLTREESDKAAREAASEETNFKASEKTRKLEYARRMAALRLAKSEIVRKRPKPVRGAGAGEDGWVIYAVVDDLDPNAVMALIRLRRGPSGLELESWGKGEWKPDVKILAELKGVSPPGLVELDDDQLESVLSQMEETEPVAAAVSADPGAAGLRSYWTSGKGRLKIRWGSPGDFGRCVKQLRKYLGEHQVKGYCANLHRASTGVWPGDRRNRGVMGTGASEDVLLDAVRAGGWRKETTGPRRNMEAGMLNDGIYSEQDDMIGALVAAGAFPTAPPDDWFDDPSLAGPTPLTVEDSGRVFGHIATFDVPHIGMPGRVHAPRSRSNYAFFKTGQLITASGTRVDVGQLTLAGGHAPLSADAAMAVKHYDDTQSAVADLNIGEDRHGIWVAGSIRAEVTTDQLRALRAAAPSGDWRPINGALELVAICQVNVPGFPVARARVASGAVVALVAAGARPLAVQKASMIADAAVLERITALESLMLGGDEEEEEEVEPMSDDDPSEPEQIIQHSEALVRAREHVREQRMKRLRERVHGR